MKSCLRAWLGALALGVLMSGVSPSASAADAAGQWKWSYERNGEMVAVWLNDRDETTLKYFYLENGRVRLQPANPTMKPIFIEDPSTVEIQGKVIMVIRQVGGMAV